MRDCLGQSTFFYCDRDKYWRLADKEAASQYLAGLRDTLSKKSDTTVSARGETAQDEQLENDDGNSSRPSKRRYQRSIPKYEETIEALEGLCTEYPTMLKNPFSGLANKSKEDQLRHLGSAEKIVGMLQCYNYFAPLISGGLKRLKTKENNAAVSNNLLGVSRVLLSLANQVDLKSHKAEKDNQG